ncbi:MAG: hypothetical protein ACKO0Z_25280 [Betaproteobacteria bacterium]
MTMYGVFSQPVGSDVETLHYTNEAARGALVQVGKHIAFEAYGSVPTTVLVNVLDILDSLIQEDNVSKEFRINEKFYYVRLLTEDEILTILNNPA